MSERIESLREDLRKRAYPKLNRGLRRAVRRIFLYGLLHPDAMHYSIWGVNSDVPTSAREWSLAVALVEVLEWPLPEGTVETWALPEWLAQSAREALNAEASPPDDGWKRPMTDRLDTPTMAELERMLATGDPLDRAIVELWRGRSVVSSVTSARLRREAADALLVALGEMPADHERQRKALDG